MSDAPVIPEAWRSYISELRVQTRNTSGTVSTISRFTKYTKETITEYLRNPINYEKQLRDASIYMYANSTHYYNLINFHALMPTWAYTLTPLKFDESTVDEATFYKQYMKVVQKVQTMCLSHEMISVFRTCFREDVFYGIVHETKDSFFIQRLNPDFCRISGVVDGVFVYEFDFSQIREENLIEYPELFTTMWNQYQKDNELRWQEIPVDVSVCLKVNQDLLYPLPPFAGSMPLLFDIEDFKDLIKQREEIANYKGLNLEIPVGPKGEPLIESDVTRLYYRDVLQSLPDGVGLMMSPMKMTSFQFEKTGLTDTDEVAQAEQRFWSSTGTSSLLFGASDSVTALKYSIKANEQLVLALMRQAERWVNRKLRGLSGKIKFRMNILPVTHFNAEDKAKQYQDACIYGLPAKSQYAVLQDMEFGDIDGMAYLENQILHYPEKFIPLSSAYQQGNQTESVSTDEGGRPTNEEKGEVLTEAGEQTQRDDENAARE